MSDTITLATLRTRVRERADLVNSQFIADSELNGYIDLSYSGFYDLLIEEENYYFGTSSSAVVSSGNTIALPSNFYRLVGLDDMTTPDYPLTVRKFNFAERNDFRNMYLTLSNYSDVFYNIFGSNILLEPSTLAQKTYKLWYIPHRTILSADGDTVDSVNGWIEWVILDAAIKCLLKEESDVKPLMIAQKEVYERITKAKGKRDSVGPDKIARVRNKPQRRISDSRLPPSF